MPIPGSILNTMFDPKSAAIMYPSLASLMPITKTVSSAGQETHTFAISTDPTQINLPCRKSPLIQIRPQNQESAEGGGIQRSDAKFQVNFMEYLNVPVVSLVEWQVSVDGRTYIIKSAESDGSGLTTRLMISDEVPFNS